MMHRQGTYFHRKYDPPATSPVLRRQRHPSAYHGIIPSLRSAPRPSSPSTPPHSSPESATHLSCPSRHDFPDLHSSRSISGMIPCRTCTGPFVLLALALFLDTSFAQSCLILPPYHGVAVVKVSFRDADQAQSLRVGLRSICELKLLDPEPGFSDSFDVLLLTPAQLRFLRITLPDSAVTVVVPDLGASIRREAAALAPYPRQLQLGYSSPRAAPTKTAVAVNNDFYTKFHVYPDLVDYWKRLNRTYPSLRLETIGESVEKRPIYAMRIGRTSAAKPVRVLFNGLLHAREWISTLAPLYAAESFAVAATQRRARLARYLSSVEVIVIPMVNPDGFVHTHTVDRLWRKNRQDEVCEIGARRFASAGVDLNRNWGVDFGGNLKSSTDRCSKLYKGTAAFSAPETAAVRDFVLNTSGIVAHVDIHSYSQLVMGPWLHTNAEPRNASEIDKLGNALARDLSSGGKEYRYGRGLNNGMYLASGTMADWVFAQGILSFTFELRPDKGTLAGFELHREQILPTCAEALKALTTVVEYTYSPNSARLEGAVSYRMGRVLGYAVAGVAFAVVVIAFAVVIGCCIVQSRKRLEVDEEKDDDESSTSR